MDLRSRAEKEKLFMKGEVLKKGKQNKMKPNSKPKQPKGMDKRKMHVKENECDLHPDIDENECDDHVSDY
jgi:hypothetical protein